ncbi:probable metal-nicotianamine transporter YSL3 [Panicum virgatum]|uniref:probable metal-nicotianamine transporter YSL3 n=1 Tax=Panicum virgatum TaxID=38727 RepID=UPI0019D59C9D|nr:probable metal-nicotianamine transporter YSL3 [Panicum virgatum]
MPSVERAFEGQPYHGFWGQVTVRAMLVAIVLAGLFSMVTLNIYMKVGVVGAFNMPINILSFVVLRSLVGLMRRCGIAPAPFTRQENIFLQTSTMTCINISLSCGFGNYFVGLFTVVAKSLSDNPDKRDIVDVTVGQYGFFLLTVGMVAIMATLPLVQWFYAGGDSCGFGVFPTFGLELYKRRFFFDFSTSFLGVGMIVPHVVNFGLLFGAIISGAILYPYLESKRGQWYITDSPSTLNGVNGYKIFMGLTMVVTEGIFNFITLTTALVIDFYKKTEENDSGAAKYILKHPSLNYDDRKRLEVFIGNRVPAIGGVIGYIGFAVICSVISHWIFREIQFHHLALVFTIIPIFIFSNTYGTGLTDWSVAPTYAKFVLFLAAASDAAPGAVIVSLVACGAAFMSLNISSQAVQDYKTAYMTLTSPRAVFAGHVYGIVIGSIINPLIYAFFDLKAKKTAPIGTPKSEFPAPYAQVYRAIALLGMGGVKELPKHCITFSFITFLMTLAIETLRLVSQRKDWKVQYYIPCMTAIALPFLSGPTFAVDMASGTILRLIWTKIHRQSAELYSAAVAAGLVSGDGIWYLPSALLGLFKVEPPICMRFLPSGKEVQIADAFLNNLGTQGMT